MDEFHEHEKKYDTWNIVKKQTEKAQTTTHFKERDIFFIKMGKNIGFEQNGKGEKFARPVIVIKKFNKMLFWGIPLSTKIKEWIYYYNFTLHTTQQCAILSQVKLFDSKRLLDKVGMINDTDFIQIKEKIKALL